MRRNVVPVDKAFMRVSFGHEDMSGVERGVVLNDHVLGAPCQLKQSPLAPPPSPVDVVKNIVPDQYSLPPSARRMNIVGTHDVHPAGAMADNIIGKRDILD